MRKALLTLVLLFGFLLTYSQNRSPRQLYPGLFETVQLTDIFPDNKIFVDAIPKRSSWKNIMWWIQDQRPVEDEYLLQDGFGWTNGVLLNLLNHYSYNSF
ncbi:trehalase family glycosidase [Mucilaginibacter sp. RCC_168]|uniref:trehalase family glycosidase n=1 Tax=Mucilaginibacter sp. RCC_168 TaxID=3239221 RepID=UPI0035256CC4